MPSGGPPIHGRYLQVLTANGGDHVLRCQPPPGDLLRIEPDAHGIILVGNEDALTPVLVALTIADEIAGSKLEIVQDCGHLSTMERPDAVTVALSAWIAR